MPEEVIDYLREQFFRLNQRLDRSDQKLAEVSQRLTTVETQLGHFTATEQTHYGVTMQRFDSADSRLDRIERRLDLVDADDLTRLGRAAAHDAR